MTTALYTTLDDRDFHDRLEQAILLISFVVEDVEGPRRRAVADANRERLKKLNAHLKKDPTS